MRYFLSVVFTLFILIGLPCVKVKAQGNTGTTTTTTSTTNTDPISTIPARAEDVSDSQLRDIVQKAKASGMSDEQIRQAAIAKGMPESEVNKLQNRINLIKTAKDVNAADEPQKERKVEGRDTSKIKKAGASAPVTGAGGLKIFGSDLFSNSNLTFEPNLRIATPQNYKLGPDDQVVINVYGNSQVDWKLNVTPDGNIQIPGIGLVNVNGKTIEQVTGLISSKLSAAHYAIGHGTNVSVGIGNIRSIKVTLVGEIQKQGTYTMSSFSTVFNALSASGGPNSIGSFRQIYVIRDNAVVSTLDIYDFLLKATQKNNIRLQDGDIIRVPTYKVRVGLSGQVKRPAVFEVIPGETLRDVINFGGGFTDSAYTSTIKATQLTSQDRKIADISLADLDNYIPLQGDFYTVDKILNSYQNRVSIFGSVMRPGQFELTNGLTLSQLITKAAGLRPDAFAARGSISRLRPDNTTELISFDVRGIVNKTIRDIPLKKEDVVTILSNFDLRDQYTVTINGEVRNGGQFPYAENMSVEDLVVQAGGFTVSASSQRIEVARRINNGDLSDINSPAADIQMINVDASFKVKGKPFVLKPFDVVSVYTLPGYETQKMVRIEGEVLYPGDHAISSKNEKISDLVMRAGGLTAYADVEAGTLKRTNVLGLDAQKQKIDASTIEAEKLQRLQHIQKTLRDSTNNLDQQYKNDYVGIDLKKILQNPGSKTDLILVEGDVLRIPKKQQLVKVDGEVLFPSSVVYESSKTLTDFVDNAGGFSQQALKRRAYVVYPNGSVRSTHNFLFFKSYPVIKPGSQIVIPKKAEKKGISLTDIATVTGSLASVAAVLIGIISITRH